MESPRRGGAWGGAAQGSRCCAGVTAGWRGEHLQDKPPFRASMGQRDDQKKTTSMGHQKTARWWRDSVHWLRGRWRPHTAGRGSHSAHWMRWRSRASLLPMRAGLGGGGPGGSSQARLPVGPPLCLSAPSSDKRPADSHTSARTNNPSFLPFFPHQPRRPGQHRAGADLAGFVAARAPLVALDIPRQLHQGGVAVLGPWVEVLQAGEQERAGQEVGEAA